MTLQDFYKANDIPDSEWIKQEKNILLIVPDKKHDLSVFFSKLGLTKYEVAVTWPKEKVDMFSEVCTAKPKLVIQVDCQFSKKFISVSSNEEIPGGLEDKVKSFIADTFVSLHHHDEFSIKDGLGTVDQLLKLLKKQKRSFCAITNHGGVGGWIKQYNACKKAGVKAIFGCLLPDQPIVTKNGVKKVQDVVTGDEVLTHKGRFKRVLQTSVREYDGKIYSPEFWGNGDCWVTEEHPFLYFTF